MERLATIIACIFFAGIALLGLGGWMIHTGINAGDVYKVILGAIAFVVGLWFTVPVLALGGR